MPEIKFNLKPAKAFEELGFPYPSFQWSQFRPVEARKDFSVAAELLITIWTHHGDQKLRDSKSFDSVALRRNTRDGTLWYHAGGGSGDDPSLTGKAHVTRLAYAISNGIPIRGVLKDYWTKRCSLVPELRIEQAVPASNGRGWWLNVVPSIEEGLEIEDIVIEEVADYKPPGVRGMSADLHQAILGIEALPESEEDGKRRIAQLIAIRQGQPAFRRKLLDAYENRCAVTGCDVVDVLEAAHIVPYNGPATNRVDNGLLLRADIHTLFDLHKIWINADDGYAIEIHADLLGGQYASINGKKLRIPQHASLLPNPHHLQRHRKQALARK